MTSTVLELVPCAGGIPAPARARALELASIAFRFRRKTLPNALSSAADRRRVERELAALGWDPRVRAEELSLDDYVALAERLDTP